MTCIIAAAGRSKRMGRWKMELPWKDTTVLQASVEAALDGGCRVIVVGGWRFSRLKRLVEAFRFESKPETDLWDDQVSIIRARDWRRGMGASVRRGLALVDNEDAFFVVPGDMPGIGSEAYRRLAGSAPEGREWAVRPVFRGKPGHPVLFGPGCAGILLTGKRSAPLKDSLAAMRLKTIPWEESGVFDDLDTPGDYERLSCGPEGIP